MENTIIIGTIKATVTKIDKENNHKVYHAIYEPTSPPVCPRTELIQGIHRCTRNGIKKSRKLDIINSEPVRVILTYPKWHCQLKPCDHRFLDNRIPEDYKGQQKTTRDFREYVAMRLITACWMTKQTLIIEYGISKNIINSGITEFWNQWHKYPYRSLDCRTLWVTKINYPMAARFLVFGNAVGPKDVLKRYHIQEDDLVLLGVTEKPTMESILSDLHIFGLDQTDLIICDGDYNLNGEEYGIKIKIVDISAFPEKVEQVQAVTEDLRQKGYSFEEMRIIIMFHDEKRRFELAKGPRGHILESVGFDEASSYMMFPQLNDPAKPDPVCMFTSSDKAVSYSIDYSVGMPQLSLFEDNSYYHFVDIDALLKTLGY